MLFELDYRGLLLGGYSQSLTIVESCSAVRLTIHLDKSLLYLHLVGPSGGDSP